MPEMSDIMGLGVGLAIMAFLAVTLLGGADHDVSFAQFDTQTELQDELTLTNVSVNSDGYVVLDSTETEGTASTPVYDRGANVSRLVSYFSNADGDLDVTVTGYDEGGAQQSQETYEDPGDIDLTSQAGTEFDFEWQFSRAATSDDSPQLDGYKVYELDQPVSFSVALVALVAIALVGFVSRAF